MTAARAATDTLLHPHTAASHRLETDDAADVVPDGLTVDTEGYL